MTSAEADQVGLKVAREFRDFAEDKGFKEFKATKETKEFKAVRECKVTKVARVLMQQCKVSKADTACKEYKGNKDFKDF
jgi:hypothetical protein